MVNHWLVELHVVGWWVEWLGHGGVRWDELLGFWLFWLVLWCSVVLRISKAIRIMEMFLSAADDVSALLVQFWCESELLTVENEHIFLLDHIVLALSAFLSCCLRQTAHPD